MRVATGLALALAALAAGGCTQDNVTAPGGSANCAAGLSPVALGVGAYASYDPAASGGCIAFAANVSAADSAEYLLVLLSTGGNPGDSAAFTLRSATAAGITAATSVPLVAASHPRASAQSSFDRFLRRTERDPLAFAAARGGAALAPRASVAPQRVTPPVAGSLRSFTVCANITCSSMKTITAAVRSVGAHVAIYVDTLAPAGGLAVAGLDTLQQTFDTHVYAVDTTAFGREPDIDSNGVVIALLTGAVNALVTKATCDTAGYVQGFFFPGDLDPVFASSYNNGEVFYALVPDPLGTLSCAHTAAELKGELPPTFLHEFEHMINFNQHVRVHAAGPEDDWLDEGLAKYAEELGGRSWLPADSQQFSDYAIGDVFNANDYLSAPERHFLLTTTDQSLPDVGAGWLFVRYVADQFGAGITRQLVQTGLSGTANVALQTGQPFAQTVTRWALADWVSDLPAFTAPPELQYTSWHFRRTYASLHLQDPADFPFAYPLVPVTASRSSPVDLTGYLRAGSGAYVRVLQGPGATGLAFALNAGQAAVPAALGPRFAVVRIR
jgi:hypothetical protein